MVKELIDTDDTSFQLKERRQLNDKIYFRAPPEKVITMVTNQHYQLIAVGKNVR